MRKVVAVLGSVATAASLALLTAPPATAEGETRLTTILSHKFEVPPPGDVGAYGFAAVRVTEDRVCFGARWMNMDAPMAGHIHEAPPGVAGPIVVPLFEAPAGAQGGNTRGCVPVDPALASDIAANPEDYYVNLHNAAFPAGAIRGQLSMAG